MVAKLVEDMLRPQSLPQGWTAKFDEAKGRRCDERHVSASQPTLLHKHTADVDLAGRSTPASLEFHAISHRQRP